MKIILGLLLISLISCSAPIEKYDPEYECEKQLGENRLIEKGMELNGYTFCNIDPYTSNCPCDHRKK